MSPGHALHRREAREGKKIRRVVHADIGIEDDIGLGAGDTLPLRDDIAVEQLHPRGVPNQLAA